MERDDNYWKIYSVDTEISETLEESLQTYGKKLFLNFKCVGFEEVVITRTSKGGAIPRTDRAIAKISSSSLSGIDNFSFHPIVRNFPQVKMKLDLNQVYRVSELVFLTFVPFSNIKIPLFMKWGIAISEIDLIVIAGDGRPKVTFF